MLEEQDIKTLTEEFPPEKIRLRRQGKINTEGRALVFFYLEWEDIRARIEQVDPNWTNEQINWVSTVEDGIRLVEVSTKLCIKGLCRTATGNGRDAKAAETDSLKRAARLFGVGAYLYTPEFYTSQGLPPSVYAKWNRDMDFQYISLDQSDKLQLGPPFLSGSPREESQQGQLEGSGTVETIGPLRDSQRGEFQLITIDGDIYLYPGQWKGPAEGEEVNFRYLQYTDYQGRERRKILSLGSDKAEDIDEILEGGEEEPPF